MPINGMTGSLFVKVFLVCRVSQCPMAVYLNLPFSWHASSVTKPVPPGQSFTGGLRLFKFSVFTDRICVSWQRETGVWAGGAEGHLGVIEIIKARLSRLSPSLTLTPPPQTATSQGRTECSAICISIFSCFSRRYPRKSKPIFLVFLSYNV